MDRLMKKAVP